MFDHYKELYIRKNEHPNYWFNKSSDLRASAGAIWYSIENTKECRIRDSLSLGEGFDMAIACWPVYKMVFGMSFELMFKAIARASGLEFDPSHDLLKLANEAQVTLVDQDSKVLSVLTEAVIWDGRYPIPKDNKRKKGKDILQTHYENSSKVLLDDIPHGEIKLKRANLVLNWESLDQIWCKLSAVFFERYTGKYEKAVRTE